MSKKYKMTGCARFFIAILIIAPLAYLGAAYFRGEDGIQNIKNFFTQNPENPEVTTGEPRYKEERTMEIEELKQTVSELKKENSDLREKVERLEKEISDLKGQEDVNQ